MKRTVLTVIKKELARFFGDKRLVFTTLLMPALMIYVMYSFMGTAMSDMFDPSEEPPVVLTLGLPEELAPLFSEVFDLTAAGDPEQAKAQIIDKEAALLMVFPEGFLESVAAPAAAVPAVELYYHSASTDSSHAYQTAAALLDSFESSLANRFDVNPGEGYDLATAAESTGTMMAMLLPMLLMTFLFSGCMSVAPESIAGEKERGTIAALLVTPASRSGIALGKICALSFIALLSGISSAAGTILALPQLMSGAEELMDVSVYGMGEYLALGAVILSTVLPLIAIISLISCFAKTVKEASGYLSPLMIGVMLLGVSSMFGSGAQEELFWYCIPLYNSVQCMTGIFSFSMVPASVPVTVVTNLICTGAGAWLLTRMFNSEKVMFSR